MRRVISLVAFLVLFGCAIRAYSQNQLFEKKWQFHSSDGVVEIVLRQFSIEGHDAVTRLSIYSTDGSSHLSAEEAGYLDTILRDLSNLGISLRSIDLLSTRMTQRDSLSRVASCVARSNSWASALKSANFPRYGYPLVTKFLNECKAYREWQQVFANHGLTLQVSGVEKVALRPFRKTGMKCEAGKYCDDLKVPVDALVEMTVKADTAEVR